MAVFSKTLQFTTQGNCDVRDITDDVITILGQSKLNAGVLVLFAPGATASITTIEYEPGLILDLRSLFERLIPAKGAYEHNAAWQDGNGHSHLRASLLGPSISIPFLNGKMTLGTWQQIVFVDFDVRARDREIVIQIIGE